MQGHNLKKFCRDRFPDAIHKFQGHLPFGPEEEFTINGYMAIMAVRTNFHCHDRGKLRMKHDFNRSSGFKEEDVQRC